MGMLVKLELREIIICTSNLKLTKHPPFKKYYQRLQSFISPFRAPSLLVQRIPPLLLDVGHFTQQLWRAGELGVKGNEAHCT